MTKTVVFDLGMVLCSPTGLFEKLADLLGTSPEAVDRGLWGEHRLAYDRGGSDRDYWVAALSRIEGAQVDDLDALLPELVAADITGWKNIRPGARAILEDLVAAGVPRYVLSNAPRVFAQQAPQFDWFELVDEFFFSGLLDTAKPDPAIYAVAEEAIGMPTGDLWFIDDRQANVDTALARGWKTHLWVDDADTRAWLVAEGFLPA